MDCPVCRESMLVVEYNEVEIDLCEECGGIWFDRDELEYLLSTIEMEVEALGLKEASRAEIAGTGDRPVRCPMCRRKMKKLSVGEEPPVILDHCQRHGGYWFDGGELVAVLKSSAPEGGWEKVFEFITGVFPEGGTPGRRK